MNAGHWALSVRNVLQRKKPDLRNNPSVKHGRAACYFPLLLAFVPVNLFCVLFRRAGVVTFYARARRRGGGIRGEVRRGSWAGARGVLTW
jgi:hypothetical protein